MNVKTTRAYAGFGFGHADPFTSLSMRACRQHPRRDPNGHKPGGDNGGNGGDGGDGGEGGDGGKPFTPITTQADFDKAISARLTRERANYADHDTYKASHDELQKIQNGQKSEAQKERERADAAEKRANEAEHRELQRSIAEAKGIPLKHAGRLKGATKEELEADADDYLEDYTPPEGGGRPPIPGKPRENLRGGGAPDEEPEETDPAKLAAQIPRN
ncbi:hypothetical protein [Rhodococcus sp. IEGM 1318]|uniref:hypothetical protein n=1 Tax=Rhodococcus sp. IEGM 1318 TaxID=3082226 RepID=UPI0029548230|nr:hypothetical protein [Rhodococcus sp. IEGM 1318]MDV8006751.1 hypothetical protein [Rhodococcus sp. IEGM 1318]